MWISFLFTVAALATLVAVVVDTCYLFQCTALEKYLASPRPDWRTDKAGNEAWRQKRFALERVRMRNGLTGIACYAVGMAAFIPLQSALKAAAQSDTLAMSLCVILSASLMASGVRSVFHNARASELDYKRQYPELT